MPRSSVWVGCLAQNFAGERQQGQVAGALDGAGQLALVFGAGPRLTAGADLAIIAHEAAQNFGLLVVNPGAAVSAELAHARLGVETPRAATDIGLGIVIIHENLLLI